MTDAHIRAKLKAHFANNYQQWLFTLSMGDSSPYATSMKALCNFLANGVALLAYYDEGYVEQMIEVHQKLVKLTNDLEAQPEGRMNPSYHAAMVAGSVLEMAAEAVQELKK